MGVLSVQSAVAAGHVGNSAAVFPLQRLGFDVWRVDTAVFSNHPAHGRHRGRIVPGSEVTALLDGLGELGLWPRCEAVISGYLGDAATGSALVEAVADIRAVRPDMLYLCDPVIGDRGRRYVGDGIVEFYRERGIPAADIVTPNAYEAECLTGVGSSTPEGAVAAGGALRNMGPRIAVVTGVVDRETMQTVAVAETGAWLVATPRLPAAGHGAGDLFAALLLGELLRRAALANALSRAVSATHAILARAADGALDLPLIAAQCGFLDPPRLYPAEPLRFD